MGGLPSETKPSGAPQLGRYELIAGIASGGMGAVMLGRLAAAGGFQRLFAIKILHRNYSADSEFLEMLLDEARITGRIHHPNVVGMHEVSESAEHGYYLVMDYVEGFPLSDVLQRFATSGAPQHAWPVVTRVVYDALQGLHAAHSLTDDNGEALHVVHRDVSPQNILVGTDGVARVTDFGIAKAAARLVQTRDGQVRGKIAYMSPEHARGQRLDNRSDLFAAGVVLWESLTLQRLFKGKNELETYAKLMNAPVRPPSALVAGLPPALDEVCMRALERDPARRYQSAREMAQALERAARGGGVFADAHEVGEWISRTFASQLAERRSAIRAAAAKDTLISSAPDMTPSHPMPAYVEKSTVSYSGALGAGGTSAVPQAPAPRQPPPARPSGSMAVPRLPPTGVAQPARSPAPHAAVDDDDDLDHKRTTKFNESDAAPDVRDAIEAYRRAAGASPPLAPLPPSAPSPPQSAPPGPMHGIQAVQPPLTTSFVPSAPPVGYAPAAPMAGMVPAYGAPGVVPAPYQPSQPWPSNATTMPHPSRVDVPAQGPPSYPGYMTPVGTPSFSMPPAPPARGRVGFVLAFVLLALVAAGAAVWIYLLPARTSRVPSSSPTAPPAAPS